MFSVAEIFQICFAENIWLHNIDGKYRHLFSLRVWCQGPKYGPKVPVKTVFVD